MPCIRSLRPLAFLGAVGAMLLAATAPAAIIAHDGFEGYTSGSNLNGGSLGNGWTGNWFADGNHTTLQTTIMVDPNGNVATGSQAAQLQATANLSDVANHMSRPFAAQTGTVYVAFLIRNVSGVGSDDFYNFQVSDGATGNNSAMLGIGIRNAANNPFFARVGSSSNSTTNASTNATQGTDFLLVGKFWKDGSINYNRADLFINPVDFTEPGTADASATFGGTGINTLSLFSVRNFQPESGDTVLIDELRIATTFEDALGGLPIPEPGVALLGALGSLLLLRRRR